MDINKREQLEQMLRDSPDVLTSIVASAMDAIIVTDDAQRIVLFNAAAERMFACPADEAIGTSVDRFIPQRFRAEHSRHVSRYGESGVTNRNSSTLGILWGLRSTGEEFPIEAAISKVEGGGTKFFAVVIRDVTERLRAEETVRESEQRFRLVADTAPVLIWMSGTDKLCTYFNKPWLDFTGRSLESELGNGRAEGVYPEDLQRCLDTYTQSFDRREKFRMEYRLRHHDGEYRWILDIGVPRFNEDGSFAGYIGIGVDVSERKRTEEELELANERLRLAMQAGRAGGWEWNIESGRSSRFGETHPLLGTTREAYTGTVEEFWDRVHPEDRVRLHEAVESAKLNKSEFNEEFRVVWPDGTLHWLRSQGRCSYGANGEPKRMLGISIDINERKRAEEALSCMNRRVIEAEERERNRIAKDLHEDVGQRLALLAVGIDQLKNHLPNRTVELLDRMDAVRKQTLEILTDVKASAHELYSPRLEYLGVAAVMRIFCEEFGERKKVEIDFRSHGLPSLVQPEVSICLFRVLQEALHNGVKHSGVKKFEVQLWGASDAIHLTVRDSGAGFDTDAARKGRALGLTRIEQRVKLVEGKFSIDSQPEKGTTVHVSVPLNSGSDSMRATG